MSLSGEEIVLRDLVRNEVPSLSEHALAVFCRLAVTPMQRPEADLVHYLARFPELGDETQRVAAIEELRKASLIEVIPTPSGSSIGILEKPEGIAASTKIKREIRRALDGATRRVAASSHIEDLGTLAGNTEQFSTWLEHIATARSEVLVWVTSSAQPALLDALRTKADEGVLVRVMIGDPDAVVLLRGTRERTVALEAGNRWRTIAKEHRNLRLRFIKFPVDLLHGGSSLIDGLLLRYTIFHPWLQRGTDGRLIEIATPTNGLNVIALYRATFERTWVSASISPFRDLVRLFRRIAIGVPLVCFLVVLRDILASVNNHRIHHWIANHQGLIDNLAAGAIGAIIIWALRPVFLYLRARLRRRQ